MFSTGAIVKISGISLEVEEIDRLGVVWLRRPASRAKTRWICRADGTGFRLCIR